MGEVRMTEERGRGGPERKHKPHRLGPEGPAPSTPGPSSHRQPCVAGLRVGLFLAPPSVTCTSDEGPVIVAATESGHSPPSMTSRGTHVTINRTQALVLGFFGLVWATLVVLFTVAPEVYYQAMKLPSTGAGLLFLVGISAFIALLVVGVLRRWRWMFWLI